MHLLRATENYQQIIESKDTLKYFYFTLNSKNFDIGISAATF